MKSHNNNQNNLSGSLTGVSTTLTPALKIQKALELMREGYEEELARIEAENKRLALEKEAAETETRRVKDLVTHQYLSATQVKQKVLEATGKKIIVSRAVKVIELNENDILYKPFKNGGYVGQQPVYSENVVDNIIEYLEK